MQCKMLHIDINFLFQSLTVGQINSLSDEQLAGISQAQIDALSAEQLTAVNTIAGLNLTPTVVVVPDTTASPGTSGPGGSGGGETGKFKYIIIFQWFFISFAEYGFKIL